MILKYSSKSHLISKSKIAEYNQLYPLIPSILSIANEINLYNIEVEICDPICIKFTNCENKHNIYLFKHDITIYSYKYIDNFIIILNPSSIITTIEYYDPNFIDKLFAVLNH